MTAIDTANPIEEPGRSLLQGGALGGVIKLSSAGLAFLMLFSVALATDPREFGLFAAAFAAASLVSFFSTMGQQSIILRFWPEYAARGETATAQAFMARSMKVAAAGTLAGGLLLTIAAFVPYGHDGIGEWMTTCLAAAVLAMALSWSEFASAAYRAKGALLSALLPRDIVWRAVMILVMVSFWAFDANIPAPLAIFICSLILIVSVARQTYSLVRTTVAARPRALSEDELKLFRHVTSGLWGVTSLPPAMSQASTLLVAIILGPEMAGGVFVAERMARLVEVAQNGINQALAPEISAAYHSGRGGHVQRISALTALASTAVSIGALLAFIVMGRFVLGLFDPAYDNATLWAVLLILSVGTALGCACGPANVLLQLTGGQHTLLRILIGAHVIGTIGTAGLTYVFGPVGAASGVAIIVVVEALGSVIVARRDFRLDPSIFGLTPRPENA